MKYEPEKLVIRSSISLGIEKASFYFTCEFPNFWLFSNQNRNYMKILVFRPTIEHRDPVLYAPRLQIIYYNWTLSVMDGFHFFWSHLVLNIHSLFKASAHWANAFYKSKCPSDCPSVCVSVHF